MRKTRRQSGGQPLSYVNPTYQNPSAPAGQNVGNPLSAQIVRPALAQQQQQQQQGGFYPSIMGGVVQNARLLIPVAARQGMSLFAKYRKGKKTRRPKRKTRKTRRTRK
jgi:hypothetical protein